MTIYMWVASLAWLLLSLGFAFRKKRSIHVPLVLLGVTMDLALVLVLQITRDAVQTAMGLSLSALEYLHIVASTGAVICYLPAIYFGLKLYRGDVSYLLQHRKFASWALILRTIGFVFMFSMWGGR